MLTNSSILITGGTGSFGHKFIPMTLKRYNPRQIVVYSRDEMKQWEMAQRFEDDSRVKVVIGGKVDSVQIDEDWVEVDMVEDLHALITLERVKKIKNDF